MKSFYKCYSDDRRLVLRCLDCERRYGITSIAGFKLRVIDDQGWRIQCIECGTEETLKG